MDMALIQVPYQAGDDLSRSRSLITGSSCLPDVLVKHSTQAISDVDAGHPEPCRRGDRPRTEVTDAPWGRWFSADGADRKNWLVVQSTEGA